MDSSGKIHDLLRLAEAHGLPASALDGSFEPSPTERAAEVRELLERQVGKLMPIVDLPAVEAMPTAERVAWFHARRAEERRDRKAARKAQRAARKKQRSSR